MTKPKDTGEMPSNERLAELAMKLCELLDAEGLQPHNQVFVLAHAYSACAGALGVSALDAKVLVDTRYLAIERLMKTAPADKRALWNELKKANKP